MSDSETASGKSRNHSEMPAQLRATEAQMWDVILDGEVIGSIHADSEARARDVILPFHNPAITLRAWPAEAEHSEKPKP